jgi:diguanylate cyclase (GGDEF)-like protein/PAS domain S-box-containing protein
MSPPLLRESTVVRSALPPLPPAPGARRLPGSTLTLLRGSTGWETEGQRRAAAALTKSNDLILFFADDGTIVWASPACTRLLGIEPEAMVGLTGIDLIHPDDRASAVADFMSIPNMGDHVTTEFRVVHADGSIRWIEEIATNLVEDPAVGYVVANLRDVTERVDMLQRIELDRRRLADAQAAARLGSFEIDLRTGDISRSDELCRILGLPVGSAANWSGLDTIHPDDRHKLTEMLGEAVAGRDRGELEYRIVRPSGEVRWVLTKGVMLSEPNTEDHIIAGTMLDITDRHAADEALSFQATHDWLTRLPNPASLHAGLRRALADASAGAQVIVAVVGIDNFRQINDARGASAGDEVLRALAARLSTRIESGDLVSRVRGDEFVLARPVSTADTTAAELGQRVLDVLAEPLSNDGDDGLADLRLSFSVGVTTSTNHDSPDSLLADADAAMHQAKRDGGGRIVVFDDDARARATRRRNICAALPFAVERNELRLEYQPIIDLSTARTVGFEALLRWTHPDLGPVAPDEFIPVAEANRLIAPIGSWVIDEALQQLADWRRSRRVPTELWVAINLSAQQLAQDDLASRVSRAIERVGIPAELVHLEITESVLMDGIEDGERTITQLHSLGINISIDDFGTGYSSLSYLSRLTVDTIKIDRSFVNALTTDRDGTSIVRAIINLANSLEHHIVAEGIETCQQLDSLRALGCTFGQGFLWSRSLHPEAALQWIVDSSQPARP